MNYALDELIDIPKLQSLLDTLDEIHSLPSAIIDTAGKIHTATAWQDICTKFHRANPETEKKCRESDSYIAQQLDRKVRQIAYRCPFGLVDTATPVIVDGHHLCNVFTGQLFTEKPDEAQFIRQAREYGFVEKDYLEALRKVPVISEERLHKNLKFLGEFAEMLATQGLIHKRQLETEAALRESERRQRAILKSSIDGFWLTDLQGHLLEVNETYCRLSGYSAEELLAMRIPDLEAAESEEQTAARMREIARIGEARFESRHRRKDGSVFDVEISVQYQPIETGRCVVFIKDVTERKRAEREKAALEVQFQQAQKMESVGRLAGGVAHDFNNMLTVILGNVQMALGQVDPQHSIYTELAEIRKAASRSADLTRQLLAFARKQTIAPRVIDLNETVASMLKMLQRLIGEDIALEWHPGAGIAPVKVDPSQIDQLLANLCVNARDAISGQGRVVIDTHNRSFDPDYCADHAGFVPGDYVQISVSDTGRGMDKETLAQIFEPFFTTKGTGKGTGLGLATVYGIVKQNGGFINVYSESGSGTTFTIYLPKHAGEIAPERTAKAAETPGRGRETILLVEDDLAILHLTARMLNRQGYAVLSANTRAEAMDLVAEHAGKIDLLLTDVVMPEINGPALVKELQPFCPGLRHLYMSGYTGNVIVHHGVLDHGVNFIQKPFSIEDLAAKVREVLDSD